MKLRKLKKLYFKVYNAIRRLIIAKTELYKSSSVVSVERAETMKLNQIFLNFAVHCSFFGALISVVILLVNNVASAPATVPSTSQHGHLKMSNSPAQLPSTSDSNNSKRYQYFSLKEYKNATLPWENPCRGTYDPANLNSKWEKLKAVKYLVNQIYLIKSEMENENVIDIKNLSIWFNEKRNKTYEFLPWNVTRASRRWYHDVQIYLAAFEFFHKLDRPVEMYKNESRELQQLRDKSQILLCEIEEYRNRTEENVKVHTITVKRMNEILKFDMSNPDDEILHKQFLKFKFRQYFERMLEVLEQLKQKKENMSKNRYGVKSGPMRNGDVHRKQLNGNAKKVPSTRFKGKFKPNRKPGLGNKKMRKERKARNMANKRPKTTTKMPVIPFSKILQ